MDALYEARAYTDLSIIRSQVSSDDGVVVSTSHGKEFVSRGVKQQRSQKPSASLHDKKRAAREVYRAADITRSAVIFVLNLDCWFLQYIILE